MHRAVPVVVVLMGFWLAACSDRAANHSDIAGVLFGSAATSMEQETVRFEMRSGSEGEEEAEIMLTGVMDFASRRVAVTLYSDGIELEMLFVADGMYMSTPDLFGGSEESWLLFSGEEYSELFGTDQPAFLSNPSEAFALLQAGGGSPEELDEGLVRGVLARHYRMSVEAGAVLRVIGLDSEIADAGTGTMVSIEAWVDDDRLLRRLRWNQAGFWDPERLGDVITIEYWDYGIAPAVSLPDEDLVVDLDDWLEETEDSWTFDDPFEGADCYGDAIDNCLAPNPAVDAVAVDPTVCQGRDALVCLVPVGTVRLDVLEAIVDFHRETAGIEVVILPSLPLDPAWIDREASQVTEWALIRALQDSYGVVDDMPSTFIGITPVDMRPESGEWGWEFGARFGKTAFGYSHGVFSYFRPANLDPYDGSPLDDELLFERASKYVGRYVALLYLDYPMGQDIQYLNYFEMYGFSDLDSMGMKWPDWPNPCVGDEPIICIVPDGDYAYLEFEDDARLVAERLTQDLGIRVDIRGFPGAGYAYPTQDSWSDEYYNDLHTAMAGLIERPMVTVIGLTDDRFAQSSVVPDHVDKAWPDERFAVASGFGAGTPGTVEHQELLYRVLLRAIAQAHYGVSLDQGPGSVMFSGITVPVELEDARLPVLTE